MSIARTTSQAAPKSAPRRALTRRFGAAALLAAAALVSVTSAQARPDLRQLTCAKAQDMVRQNGHVVFTTSNTTYSLFVSNRSYCDPREVLRVQYGPTKDVAQCPVAYECVEPLFRPGELFERR
ncbi:hypothetical protein [Roseibium aestuarii]|uniref:Secreted protein n=1 Tax=Roseibium aestuarii TaxID=2600299 RepID=A0ABW4K1Q5_9HYPH|nr:hypothetical protein [Roseibium aestuarii]